MRKEKLVLSFNSVRGWIIHGKALRVDDVLIVLRIAEDATTNIHLFSASQGRRRPPF
jgi:hypothetical protein